MNPESLPRPTPAETRAWTSFSAGARATAGLGVGGMVFGILFGILATGRGMQAVDAILMSATVFAGAAQVAVLELWREPLPYVPIALTAALVGARNVLMAVTLYDTLSRNRRWPPFATLFLLTDANWVLTRRETQASNRVAFFVGSGVAMYVAWMTGTIIGVVVPGVLDATTISGLRLGGALFIAILLCIFFQGSRAGRLLAPALSAGIAVTASHWYGNAVALMAGVAAAALATFIRERLRRD